MSCVASLRQCSKWRGPGAQNPWTGAQNAWNTQSTQAKTTKPAMASANDEKESRLSRRGWLGMSISFSLSKVRSGQFARTHDAGRSGQLDDVGSDVPVVPDEQDPVVVGLVGRQIGDALAGPFEEAPEVNQASGGTSSTAVCLRRRSSQ